MSEAGERGTVPKRRSGPKSRTSPYIGVTQYKRTGRWEAHIWVQNPRAKGFQRHLGSYYSAEEAARCYDRAAIRFRGPAAELNFSYDSYAEDEFLKTNMRTEKFRFLDLMRAQFSIQTEKPIARRPCPTNDATEGTQRARQRQEAAPDRELLGNRRARASPSPDGSYASLPWRQQQDTPLLALEPRPEDDQLLLPDLLAVEDCMREELPPWGGIAHAGRAGRAGDGEDSVPPSSGAEEEPCRKVQRTGLSGSQLAGIVLTLPTVEPCCLSLSFQGASAGELMAAVPTPAAQLKPTTTAWDDSTDLEAFDLLAPPDLMLSSSGWDGAGF